MLSTLLKRSVQVHIVLISLAFFPCFVLAVEPIGMIGQPFPEQHAFLSNEAIVRVVPTHIQIIDANTGAVIDEFGERTSISDVVFSPTASHLAILNHSVDPRATTLIIWDVKARQQIYEWKFGQYVSKVAFSPTDAVLATALIDGIYLWNWQTGAFIGKIVPENTISTRVIVFSADGRHLITALTHLDIELWDIKTLRSEEHFVGYRGDKVKDIVMSPDGTVMAMFKNNPNSVHVLDMQTRHLLWQERNGLKRISNIVFSPDSQYLYIAT